LRLAAQEKLGFYPAPSDACEGLLRHLALGEAKGKATEHYVLDPCAGEGAFINQLAEGLHIPAKNVHAIELHKGRGEAVKLLMPGAQVLAPCSLFQTHISGRSFGLIYCNPPFDDQLGGGGREETEFVKESYNLLADNGILVVVSPLRTFQNREFVRFLDNHVREPMLYRFPEPQFNEVIMIGRKRNTPLAIPSYHSDGFLEQAYCLIGGHYRSYDGNRGRYPGVNSIHELPIIGTAAQVWSEGHPAKPPVRPMTENEDAAWLGDTVRVWEVPPSYRPSRFAKGMYTDEELIEAVLESPHNALYREIKDPPLQESPLPLDCGHVALLVTSGALDGFIDAPGCPHVMRGISRKKEELNEEQCKATLSEDGKTMRVTEVYSEEMDTRIRAVDATHVIYTFCMQPRTIEGLERQYEIKVEAVEGCEGADVIKLRQESKCSMVTAKLNDEEDVEFLWDTGASVTLISGELASKLQLMRTGKTKHLTNADGQTSPHQEALIGSFQIGRFVIKNVRCTVHDRPEPGFTPLLGQNILRLFDQHYSQSEGTVTLTLVA
jgi:predicted aspartyl protease